MGKVFFALIIIFMGCKDSMTTIFYVNPDASSIYRINRNTFKRFFGDEIRMKTVDSEIVLNCVNQLELTSEKFSIDTRALIIINNDTLEANKFYLKKNENIYRMTKELNSLIWN